MIMGIVLFAFAMRTTVAHVGDELVIVPALSLCGGARALLFAYVGLRFRISRSLRGGRLFAAIASAELIPVALEVPALVTLTLVAAVWLALHAYELIWWRAARPRRAGSERRRPPQSAARHGVQSSRCGRSGCAPRFARSDRQGPGFVRGVGEPVSSAPSQSRRERIIERIRAIPEGFVRTYGDIDPRAPRLVGLVLSQTDADVPWQRVVRADGSLAKGARQRELLLREGIPMRGDRVDLKEARFPPEL